MVEREKEGDKFCPICNSCISTMKLEGILVYSCHNKGCEKSKGWHKFPIEKKEPKEGECPVCKGKGVYPINEPREKELWEIICDNCEYKEKPICENMDEPNRNEDGSCSLFKYSTGEVKGKEGVSEILERLIARVEDCVHSVFEHKKCICGKEVAEIEIQFLLQSEKLRWEGELKKSYVRKGYLTKEEVKEEIQDFNRPILEELRKWIDELIGEVIEDERR